MTAPAPDTTAEKPADATGATATGATATGATATDATGGPASWQSLYVFLHGTPEETDAFVTEDLAPLLDGLTEDRPGADWFFIRYGEDGPHLRVRFRGLPAAAGDGLAAELGRRAAARTPLDAVWPSRHGEVRAVPYEPETARYGGPEALPVAEEVFVHSTRAVVRALRAAPDRAARLTLAADLAHTTAHALGLDPLDAAGWLRRHAASWRWIEEVELLPAAAVHSRVNAVFARQRQALHRRARQLRESLDAGTAPPRLADWAERVRAADGRLRGAVADEQRLAWVWASQLHMLFNRLGVTPDEERAVCRLAARTLLETEDAAGFFPAGHRAADYQYLERSKFQVGRAEDSVLRDLPPAGPGHRRPPEIPLVADPLPPVPLAAALRGRASVRGSLHGPLTAGTLGGVVWSAYAESHRSEQPLADGSVRELVHRPYPSAGALYTARLRLLALDVDGLPAGTYDCLPERRTLALLGPAPAVADIEALSSYLSRPAEDPDAVGIAEAPAVLALHLDLGRLRGRYGLRALRLGLLEAGHLAQTLLLTAGAFGLATVPLGGLHDDLAHELLGLDDLDQPVQYLLPLGRPRPGGTREASRRSG